MALEHRKATCDICGFTQAETQYGAGWTGWVIVNGIGAVEQVDGEILDNKHLETYVCPDHVEAMTQFITDMQEGNQLIERIG